MDLELSAEQREIVELFASMADRSCPPAQLREHEALGFAPELWAQLVAVGAPGMGAPTRVGGGGGGLLELALAAEALGARLAPVPFVEHVVAARLLARVDAVDPDILTAVVTGAQIATLALRPAIDGLARLVPAGAIAGAVVGLDCGELVVVTSDAPGVAVANLASAPLADRVLDESGAGARSRLADDTRAHELHEAAVDEWRVLTAAALAGLGASALAAACAYVTERHQFGVPIGSFQAIQHELAEVSVAIDGAQLLARKAAWAFDHDRPEAPDLAAMALLYSAERSQHAAERALHFHGGYGYMQEYDIQLHYRRAKGWPLVLDSPTREYARLATRRYGPLALAAV